MVETARPDHLEVVELGEQQHEQGDHHDAEAADLPVHAMASTALTSTSSGRNAWAAVSLEMRSSRASRM